MIKKAEAADVAERFVEFLEEVQAGTELLVLRNDRPVARITAARNVKEPCSKAADPEPMGGQWTGEAVLRSGDLSDEMFQRE